MSLVLQGCSHPPVRTSYAPCSHLKVRTVGGVFAPPFAPPSSPLGEEVGGTGKCEHLTTDGVVVRTANSEHPAVDRARHTSLYVATTLAWFTEPHDPSGRCPLAADFTQGDGRGNAWAYRRLDGRWYGWLNERVQKAGKRLSVRQAEDWQAITAWAADQGLTPIAPPRGYLPPVAFMGSMWRYDHRRTDRSNTALCA